MNTANKLNGELPAFACVSETYQQDGLTKREHLTALAMQAFASNPDWAKSMRTPDDWDEYKARLASGAVELADAVLSALEKK